MSDSKRYPRTVEIKDGTASLDLMTADAEEEVLAFAAKLPPHDLLFLRRDITQAKVLSAWAKQIETGEITSLLARNEAGEIIGCTAVVQDEHSWSPHVGELRVLVAPAGKDRGLGRQRRHRSTPAAHHFRGGRRHRQSTRCPPGGREHPDRRCRRQLSGGWRGTRGGNPGGRIDADR